jgi:hypothetical protein
MDIQNNISLDIYNLYQNSNTIIFTHKNQSMEQKKTRAEKLDEFLEMRKIAGSPIYVSATTRRVFVCRNC